MTYSYFANGWLKKVKSGANTIAEYIYDAVGNRVRIDFGNGTYTTYSYDSDPRYRVNSIAHYRAGTPAVELATISYATRDAVGNPESIVDWVGTWSYGYDANNRLDWALVPDVVGGPAARAVPSQPACGDYVYDWVGNRLRPPYGTGNEMVYNKADQLIRWPGMHTYAYDGTGNLTQVKNDSETQVVKSYAYDAYGSLLSHDRFEGSVNQPYQYVGQLGYYTHWMEPDFELLQLGVRFYDPEFGRFTQRDPIRDGLTFYDYATNPLLWVDPNGMVALTARQWKIVNCHLRALCSCFSLPARGHDPGYELLRDHFCGLKDRRKAYDYDPNYPEYAKNTWSGPVWTGLTFGKQLAAVLNGCCEYNELLSYILIHEFMHFDDEYWYTWIRSRGKEPLYYRGEDPHMYYNSVARYYLSTMKKCVKDKIKQCCK